MSTGGMVVSPWIQLTGLKRGFSLLCAWINKHRCILHLQWPSREIRDVALRVFASRKVNLRSGYSEDQARYWI